MPTRDELKVALLWCARMLLSLEEGKPFSGPLRVSVRQTDDREEKVFRPRPTLDGMEPPKWFALREDEQVSASTSELLRVLFSPDEDKLMVDLVKHQPCSATSVLNRCKAVLGTSDFWAVWGQLQKRELVEQGDDERYRVGPEWLEEWLRRRVEGKTVA